MITLELYIGDDKLELGEDTIIALTRQVNNLGELKDRQTDFTNTFSIPKSKNNQEKLESSDNINSTSNKPYQKSSSKIIRGGIEIVQNGITIIESVKDNYEINILSGNANFFEELGDKKLLALFDVTMRETLHTISVWNRTNIIANIGDTSGMLWPILDRGVFDNTRWLDTRSLWPVIYVHTFISYIFEDAGFSKAGDYLDSDDYKKLILPYVSIKANDLVREKMAAWKYANYHTFNVVTGNSYAFYVKWESVTKYDPYFLISEINSIWRYSVPSGGLYKIHVYMRVGTNGSHDTIKFHLRSARENLFTYTIDPSGGLDTSFTLDYEGYLLSQDNIYVGIEVPIGDHSYLLSIDSTSKFTCVEANVTNTGFGCQIPCGINLPDITQKELLKSLAWMHCLLFITDNITKTVHFIKFSDIIKNKRIAYDWSDKLDLSKDREPELKFKFGTYGQTNYLKYKEDEDVELGLGDDYFNFEDEVLPVEKTLIEMSFAATESKECLEGIVCATIKCQSLNKGHLLDLDEYGKYHSIDKWNWILFDIDIHLQKIVWYYGASAESVADAKFDEPIIGDLPSSRILAVKKVADVGDDIKFYEGNYSDYTGKDDNINIAYFIHPSYGDISFNGLIDDHYQEFINTMNKPKVLTAYFKLSPIDILQFNFAIPVWIDYYQSYFYVNKIEEYQGEITKVVLIKI